MGPRLAYLCSETFPDHLNAGGIYLGRVSDSEATRWMDILHGK
jgi:hypothetical protein